MDEPIRATHNALHDAPGVPNLLLPEWMIEQAAVLRYGQVELLSINTSAYQL